LDKRILNDKLAQAAKNIYSYCLLRTSTREEAEDLSQDILLEIMKSACNLRDVNAFYGFIWAIAGNVYKNWCKKRGRLIYAELDESLPDQGRAVEEQLVENDDIALLRRELSLLTEKYRRCAVLYYVEEYPVSKIAQTLDISESMVKYLLFKARKKLKEGMNMVRNYGEQSYNPRNLTLIYYGEGPNRFSNLIRDKKIPQNILWACYNDLLTEEEISLQIGVAVPYLDEYINYLADAGLLIKKGDKYSTNIIIFTKQLRDELANKKAPMTNETADKLYEFITANEEKIRSINYQGSKASRNSFIWQISIIAFQLLIGKITATLSPKLFPKTAFGERAYVWGVEEEESILSICNLSPNDGIEGELRMMDYLPSDRTYHGTLYTNRKLANILIRLASNKLTDPNDYDKEYIAELIKLGYAVNNDGVINVTIPVFTRSQIATLYELLTPITDELLAISAKIKQMKDSILLNHVPNHLKEQVSGISCMRMFNDIIGAVVINMVNKDYLKENWETNEIPTYYAVIEE